jgi:ATP-binding cassette subfamily B protein
MPAQVVQTDILQLHEKLRHEKVLFIPQGGDVLPATVRENLLNLLLIGP